LDARARRAFCEAQQVLNIALVSPRGPLYRHRGGIWRKSLRYTPLTLPTLASLIPADLPHRVRIYDEGIDDIPEFLEADLVGISAITGTAPRSYELAERFRRQGKCVVLGGVHPTLLPDEAARHADAVVTGYAEDSWPQLLRDFVARQLKPRYSQAADLSLANRPFPRRDLYPGGKVTVAHTIEATRGCIHRCQFCVVPTAWGRPLQHPVGEVVADLRHMGARRVIFLDLNLIADVDYAKELFQALIPLKITWGGLATTAIARDPELLELAGRSGCRGLLIGFESLSEGALRDCKKGFNLLQEYSQVIRAVHQQRIAIMGTFVFGMDEDHAECFEQTVDFVIRNKIELPRYAIQTPFPATPLYQRLEREGRILTHDWSLYDGQHVVYQPQAMSPEQLLRGTEWAWKNTYSYSAIARRFWGSNFSWAVFGANLGYRFYAYNLSRFYTCREVPLAA